MKMLKKKLVFKTEFYEQKKMWIDKSQREKLSIEFISGRLLPSHRLYFKQMIIIYSKPWLCNVLLNSIT